MQNGKIVNFELENNYLVSHMYGARRKSYSRSETYFIAKDIDFELIMQLEKNGKSKGLVFRFVEKDIEEIQQK